jgi:hypothetical protein
MIEWYLIVSRVEEAEAWICYTQKICCLFYLDQPGVQPLNAMYVDHRT